MATLNDINLSTNTRWLNEFEGSAVESQQKWTEGGRLFVFQKRKQKFRKIQYDCGWQTYAAIKQMVIIRDSGAVVPLLHNDSTSFNVIVETIESEALKNTNKHSDTAKFKVILNLIEV